MVTKLAEYIASTGLTQVAFARQHGFPTPMVCQWSNAKRRPGRDNAIAIERATGGAIPADYWKGVAAENNNGRRPAKRSGRRQTNG